MKEKVGIIGAVICVGLSAWLVGNCVAALEARRAVVAAEASAKAADEEVLALARLQGSEDFLLWSLPSKVEWRDLLVRQLDTAVSRSSLHRKQSELEEVEDEIAGMKKELAEIEERFGGPRPEWMPGYEYELGLSNAEAWERIRHLQGLDPELRAIDRELFDVSLQVRYENPEAGEALDRFRKEVREMRAEMRSAAVTPEDVEKMMTMIRGYLDYLQQGKVALETGQNDG